MTHSGSRPLQFFFCGARVHNHLPAQDRADSNFDLNHNRALTRGGSSRGNDERRCIKDACMFYSLIAAVVLNLVLVATPVYAQDRFIIVASTTSVRDSGLFEHLLPIFKQKTGITVMVWAQGSGAALDTRRRGKADVVLVHSKSAEEKFIAE